jgi:hypothetical protein
MVRPVRKSVIAALTCAALLFAQGWIGTAVAAEWPTWPRPKTPAPETTPAPAPTATPSESEAAAKKGEEDGKKAAGWLKSGTVTKAALVAAGIVGIAIAIGGGSSSSNHP